MPTCNWPWKILLPTQRDSMDAEQFCKKNEVLMTFLSPMTSNRWRRLSLLLSTTWNMNMRPPTSRQHLSVLVILPQTHPLLFSSVPSAPSLARTTSMTQLKGLIPSSCTRRNSSTRPRVLSGNEEEEWFRIWRRYLVQYRIHLPVWAVQNNRQRNFCTDSKDRNKRIREN